MHYMHETMVTQIIIVNLLETLLHNKIYLNLRTYKTKQSGYNYNAGTL